jgi:hypothetical protein
MTPNTYMTDEAWIKLAPFIANGIRKMLVIKDHPNRMVCMTLYGFGSHLVPEALQAFTDAKIKVVKEEGDTLQVNQAYNQSIAKEDKKLIGETLDSCRSNRKLAVLNQGTIVSACIHALRKVKRESWMASFKKVNLHPHHKLDFNGKCNKIDSKLKTGERFFKNRVGLFDAMPAFWKYMPAKQRRLVVALIDGFYEKAKDEGENPTPWILNNVLELIKHVALENIQQLRGCYLTTKIDSTVLIDSDPTVEIEAVAAVAKRQQEGLICNYNFSWKP